MRITYNGLCMVICGKSVVIFRRTTKLINCCGISCEEIPQQLIIHVVVTSYYSIIFSVLAPSQYSMNESKLKINTINRIVIPKVINLFLIGTLVFD